MNGDIWVAMTVVLPLVAISLTIVLRKSDRNARIAAATIAVVIFIACTMWSLFFR